VRQRRWNGCDGGQIPRLARRADPVVLQRRDRSHMGRSQRPRFAESAQALRTSVLSALPEPVWRRLQSVLVHGSVIYLRRQKKPRAENLRRGASFHAQPLTGPSMTPLTKYF